MQHISSYRRLYIDKGHALLFELSTRIHAAICIPHLWFHSNSCPLFAPAGCVLSLLCFFPPHLFIYLHQLSFSLQQRSAESGHGHGPTVVHPSEDSMDSLSRESPIICCVCGWAPYIVMRHQAITLPEVSHHFLMSHIFHKETH